MSERAELLVQTQRQMIQTVAMVATVKLQHSVNTSWRLADLAVKKVPVQRVGLAGLPVPGVCILVYLAQKAVAQQPPATYLRQGCLVLLTH
jgi:hypothetical protein